MARADIKAGRAYVELYVQKSAFLRGMNEARQELAGFADNMLSVGRSLGAAFAAIAATSSVAVASFIAIGSELDDISQRTGVAASELAKLGYAAQMSGTDINSVEAALKKMAKVITDAEGGSKSASAALATIGLASKDLAAMKPEQQFSAIAERLAEIEDPTKRAAVAMQLFGKSGTMLLPMLGDLEKFRKEAEALGIIPLDKDITAAAALGDAFDRMKKVVMAGFFEIAAALEPLIRKVVDFVTVFGVGMIRIIRDNQQAIISASKFTIELGVLAATIIGVGVAAKVASLAIGLFMAILANPVTVLAVAAAIVLAKNAMLSFQEVFAGTFSLMSDLISAGEIETAFQVFVASLKVLWLEFTTYLPNAWNETVRYIAKGIARLQGLLGYDSDGLIKIIDEDFDRSQKAILSDLTKAREDLTKLKNEALAKVAAAKKREEMPAAKPAAQAPGEPPAPPPPKPPMELQASGARSIGSFSAAAFSAQSGGVLNELKLQYEATKKIAQQLIENQKQQHEDMQLQNRIIQQAGPVFS